MHVVSLHGMAPLHASVRVALRVAACESLRTCVQGTRRKCSEGERAAGGGLVRETA